MNYKYSAPALLLCIVAIVSSVHAQITWDGETNNRWNVDANWVGDAVPTAAQNVLIDNNTGFTGGNVLDLFDTEQVNAVTIDPIWTGGQLIFRVVQSNTFTINDSWTYTANSTQNQTFRSTGAGSSFVRMDNSSFVNNGSGSVTLQGTNATTRLLQFIGGAGDTTMTFGGSGNFQIESGVRIRESDLERVWTDAAFGGTLTLNGDTDFMDPATDFRIRGGTVVLLQNEQIGNSTQLSFDGNATLDATGITETAGLLFQGGQSTDTGTILLDGTSSLEFIDFRQLTPNPVDLNVTGWIEGGSSIVFSDLGSQFYTGTIAEGAEFDGITIGGSPAYLTDFGTPGGTDWALSAVPEPSTYALIFGALIFGYIVLIRRNK